MEADFSPGETVEAAAADAAVRSQPVELSTVELRILGALMEKEVATPDYYPLTLNALLAACNQKSNRFPVMELAEKTLERALERLREVHHLACRYASSGGRTPKYLHTIKDRWAFSREEQAVLCELFLRGEQTDGEIRSHASRLFPFADLEAVRAVLEALATRPEGPFVELLPREAGRRERRWRHLCGMPGDRNCGEPISVEEIDGGRQDRLAAVESALAALRAEHEQLRSEVEALKKLFE